MSYMTKNHPWYGHANKATTTSFWCFSFSFGHAFCLLTCEASFLQLKFTTRIGINFSDYDSLKLV
jgi:hypothetical protein